MRRDVMFISQGVRCTGWLYVPDTLAEGEGAPAIVMANALTAVKEIVLPNYAERFAAAGFVVLAFDYRYLGASEAEPRGQIFPHEQVDDLRNAISWLSTQPEVDADRIGLWGVSLGGAHAISLAPFDRRIKAAVATVPSMRTTDALTRSLGSEGLEQMMGWLNHDRAMRYQAGAPTYIKAVSDGSEPALMPSLEAYQYYTQAGRTIAPNWRNQTTVETVEKILEHDPTSHIHLISPTPLCVVVAEHDQALPTDLTVAAFERAQEPKKLLMLPCGHTDVYDKEPWVSQSANTAIDWFKQHLSQSHARGGQNMSTIEENKALINKYFDEAWNKRNPTADDQFISPDVVIHGSPLPGAPPGLEGAKAVLRMFITAFPDLNVTNEDLVAEGDKVVQRWVSHVTHLGPLMGIPPTGKKVTLNGMNLFRIANGKIVERWGVFDALGLMQQLGVVPGGPGGGAEGAGEAAASPPRPEGTPRATSIEENKEVYRRFVEEVINQGNIDLVDELFSPDYVDHNRPPGAPPGLAGVRMIPTMFRTAFPDVNFTIDQMIGEGDKVATYVTGRGTHQGPFAGVAPTGKHVSWASMGIFRVAGGKIVEHWGIPDLMDLMRQIGGVPPVGAPPPPDRA